MPRAIAHCSVALLALLLGRPAAAQSSSDYFAVVDLDADGRVSLEEFQERMGWAFRQMDRNADGVLSPDEQLVAHAATLTLAEHRRRLAEQFHRQDKNHDGWLSRREFLAPPG
jgi:Ca2+-binding EF-hand superfamily protein